MFDIPLKRRGRGAQSNHSGRFETLHKVNIDDGWQSLSIPTRAECGAGDGDTGLATSQSSLDSSLVIDDPLSIAPLRTQWREDRAKTVITRNNSPDLPFERSINPYRGCEHGCVYCFARPSHTFLGHSAGLDFERLLYAKLDAASLLRRELANPTYRCKTIAVGVNTDAYQPLERDLGITRQLLEVMLETQHPVYLITKSSLIERDLDLLTALAEKNLITVSVSITSLDNELSHRLEPRACAPHRRLRVVKTLSEAGVPVRASVSPIIPALNEHELDDIVSAAAHAGASGANAIVLRLPHELAELFPEWLEAHYPLRKSRILKAIRSLRDGKLNDSEFKTRFVGNGPRAQLIVQRFRMACRRNNICADRELYTLDTTLFKPPTIEVDAVDNGPQLSLFADH